MMNRLFCTPLLTSSRLELRLYFSDCHTRLCSFGSGVEPLTTCAKQLAPSTTLLRAIGPVLKSTSGSWYFSVVLEQENWGFKNIRCGIVYPDFYWRRQTA